LPSMARRFAREQSSQKTRLRPFSTEVVQVSVAASSGSCRPQKSHVVMVPTGNPDAIHTAMDLCGKTISIQTGGLVETVSAEASTACTDAGKEAIDIQGYAKVADEFQQIVLGRVDAIWETQEAVADWMTRNPDAYEVAFVASQDKTYGIYYQKGKADIGEAFAAALRALKDDGTLATIATDYNLDPATLDAIE